MERIQAYAGDRIVSLGESDRASARVRATILTAGQGEIPVDYRMLRRGDRWVVYDVLIEGVSLVANYRAQFNKIIQTSSYQALVGKLRAKRG